MFSFSSFTLPGSNKGIFMGSASGFSFNVWKNSNSLSIGTGIVPDNWLIGNIKPIYKKKVIKWIQKIISQLQYLAVSENFLPQS
jgi:hypothetical protein